MSVLNEPPRIILTRYLVIRGLERAMGVAGGLPLKIEVSERTFTELAKDYVVSAGCSDAVLYAAGVPITASADIREDGMMLMHTKSGAQVWMPIPETSW